MTDYLHNLDWLAAKHAQKIIYRIVDTEETQKNRNDQEKKPKQKLAESLDNTATKALGVLQENGVYACFLYLQAKEKENGTVIVDEMLNLLEGLDFGWGKPSSKGVDQILQYIIDKVSSDLERLLLTKETLEQMLIYVRYGAKARS